MDHGTGPKLQIVRTDIDAEGSRLLSEAEPKRLGLTFGELSMIELEPREEIICGLARRENGLLNAPTDAGKSTLIRNMAIAKATGRAFAPFIEAGPPGKVAIIDTEDTKVFLRNDLRRMVQKCTPAEKAVADANLLIICEPEIEDEPLQLNRPDHLLFLSDELSAFKPDVTFIDTISRTFVIINENDNSEIKEKVMKPLKRLAVMTNSAVLAVHHIGKSKAEEGGTKEPAHRGRGASSFADQSRVIFNLERDTLNDRVVLTCAKLKGLKFDNQMLRLDADARWFEVESSGKILTAYESVIEIFQDGSSYKTSEVLELFKGRISQRVIKEKLAEGLNRGDLDKPSHGLYIASNKMLEGGQD